MTREQFIDNEIMTWGYDYIFDLIDRGYLPIDTDRGWKWMLVSNQVFTNLDLTPR